MSRLRRIITSSAVAVAAACAVVTAPSTASAAAPGCATGDGGTRTVPYLSLPGVPQNLTSLDVHSPAGQVCNVPVVLWVHGGSYTAGDKANQMANKAALFNAQGWLLLSINYRLTVPGDASSAHFPDHYTDVAAAVTWVHDHIGDYGGDPGRIALLGHSAGADIVANVADNPAYLQADGLDLGAFRCAGPLDTEGFDKTDPGASENSIWAEALGNDPDFRTKTSPTVFARAGSGIPATIGVYRGVRQRQQIEKSYLSTLAGIGVPTTTIDATTLTHQQVNARIGAPGDTVMTPPLMSFLRSCFT